MSAGAEPELRLDLVRLAAVGSTNDLIREAAEAGAAAGRMIVAEQQTAGRGRHGRIWQSPPGNLYASLLLRPTRPMGELASLSLVVGLVLAEAVEALGCPVRAELKWPNDVLLGDGKLAGILLEGSSADGRRCDWLIVGMGINVRAAPGVDVGYPTATLAAAGLPNVQPGDLLGALCPRLTRGLAAWERAGFAPFRDRWLARARGLGGAIELRLGQRTVQGTLEGIDMGGALLVRGADGVLEHHAAGELVLPALAG